jgi:hypothetical protein
MFTIGVIVTDPTIFIFIFITIRVSKETRIFITITSIIIIEKKNALAPFN